MAFMGTEAGRKMSSPLTEQGTVTLLGFTQSGGRGGARPGLAGGRGGAGPGPAGGRGGTRIRDRGGRGGARTRRRAGWAGPAPSPRTDSREGLQAEGTP